MSWHLVKNNSTSASLITPITHTEPKSARSTTFTDYGHVIPQIFTPKKAKELRAILRPSGDPTPTERLLFRRIKKGWDLKDFRLTIQARRIEELEVTVKQLKPSKQRKIVPDPNTTFTDIENIRAAQEVAGRSVEKLKRRRSQF